MSDDVVRVLERLNVRPGHEAELAAVCGPLVAAIGREDGSVQAQVAVDETGAFAVVLQSFAGGRALAAHLDNEEVLELSGELERHAEHDAVRILGALPEKLLGPLLTMGLPAELGDPWPGVARAADAAPGQPGIEVYVEVWLVDEDQFRAGIADLQEGAAHAPGVLCHRAFALPGGRVGVLESYTDSDAMLAWMASPEYAGRGRALAGAADILFLDVIGEPGERGREVLAPLGARFHRPVVGYNRFERLRLAG